MPENSDQKVKITLNVSGVKIELECLPSQIEHTVQNALKGIKATDVAKEETQSTHGSTDRNWPRVNIPKTCKELLMSLHKENWFRQDKGLGEVAEELARRGFNYDRSAVSHTLLEMTRLEYLTRKGAERRYRYINKRPLDDTAYEKTMKFTKAQEAVINLTQQARIMADVNRGDHPPLSKEEEKLQKEYVKEFVETTTKIDVGEIDEKKDFGNNLFEDMILKDVVFLSNYLKKRKMDLSDLKELMTKNPKKYQKILDEVGNEIEAQG